MEACFLFVILQKRQTAALILTQQNLCFFFYHSFDIQRVSVAFCLTIPSMDHPFLQLLFDELFILYTFFVDVFGFKEPVQLQAPV